MGELGAVGIFICFVKIVTAVSEKIYEDFYHVSLGLIIHKASQSPTISL